MANIGELSVWVKVDDKSLNKATKQVQTEFKKTWDGIEQNFTDKTVKWSWKIKSAFAWLWWLIAKVFSITAIVSFTKSLFSLWSDLEETSSKFDVIFNWSEKVKQNFDNLAKATNRSSLDLMIFWGNVWNVLAPLWLAQSEVDGLSLWLTQLAIDVASFNNASDKQVIGAFTSALSWEREALKSLWIVISESDVQNKAYSLWLQDQWKELTKAQKALATYQLLLDNTTNAQGDAIKTWDSFANQLKGLRGAIKDVFANAWKDVAWSTAWLLKNITVFVSSYGWAIITTIVETGKIIWSVIWDLFKTFWGLFSFINTWSTQNSNDMQWFAFVFMKIVQWFWVGVNLIVTAIKSLFKILVIILWAQIEVWKAFFKSIWDWWNILYTSIVWTFKSIIDVVVLSVKVIWDLWLWLAEALVWVFKGIATNVWVAMQKAWNLAIKWLNKVIDAINKVPWIDINRLAWLWDADFKPFELKIWKTIGNLKDDFAKFWSDIKWNYAGIWASFWNIANNYWDWIDNIVGVSKEAFSDMWNDWNKFWENVVEWNQRIETSLKEGAKKAEENAKLYEQWYFSILDLIDKYKWSVDDAKDKTGQQWKVAKDTIDQVKTLYKDWEKKIEDVNKASEKLAEDTKKYNQDIEDSIRAIWKELDDSTTKYEDAIWKIQSETAVDIAQRWVELAKNLADIETDIADAKTNSLEDEVTKKEKIAELQDKISLLQLKINENTSKTSESTKQSQKLTLAKYNDQLKSLQVEWISLENQQKLTDLEKEKTDILKEQEFIVANTTEAQRLEAQRRAWLSEAEKTKEDAQIQIDAQTKEFEAEKTKLESLQRINKTFLDLKKLDQQELDKILANERFLNLSQEEQELIMKLARDKIQLTAQKDAIILQQQEIADATITLSNSTTAIQLANITAIETEYATLINQINTAIAKQRELNAVKWGWQWFASGWFTWSWWANEVAWVVHKWEWVAPKWMVNSMRPLFDSLENSRGRWFADWWYTNTTNKTQNNNITVNWWADLKWFIDYAKWKL